MIRGEQIYQCCSERREPKAATELACKRSGQAWVMMNQVCLLNQEMLLLKQVLQLHQNTHCQGNLEENVLVGLKIERKEAGEIGVHQEEQVLVQNHQAVSKNPIIKSLIVKE